MMLLDMDSSKPITSSSMNSKTDFLLGRDVEEIQMHDFHSNVNGKPVRHVMILGEAGAGKSTLSRNYFAAVKDRRIESLKYIEMVIFVNAFDLVSDTTSKIFDLFFTHQMAGDPQTELTSELRDAGLYWVQNNSSKMLVIIDGLDQYSAGIGGRRYPKIDDTTPAFPDTVLTNLFSGNIWPSALILTTSRWSVFWELMNHQNPDKVVGLRGFDDLNMEKAAQNIIPESSEKMLSYIKNASPKLLALCQNPMFLSYTSKVYQRSDADLPDTISGLMAEVFSDFMHSCHPGNPDLESVTKLAFCGMMENRFEFSVNYLKKHDINPKNLEGFLASGAFFQPGQNEANYHGTKYAFSHQSMQEFCAAMHITILKKSEIEHLINNKLNDNSMDLMKKLLYGVILDEQTTRRVQVYIEDRTCTIDECREILLKWLREKLSNGVIYDIQFATLIAECGDTTIQKIKNSLHRIHIDAFDLLKNDQRTLISLIKQCSKECSTLKKIFIQQLWLDPVLVENVLSCCRQIKCFEAGYEVTDSISPKDFEPVMNLLENTKIVRVNLRCSDEVKRLFLTRWLERTQISFGYLGLLNVLDPDIMNHLFVFLSKFSLDWLRLNFNFFVTKKLVEQLTGNIKYVQCMMIEDKLFTREKLDVYFTILKAAASNSLILCRCDLTMEKLDIITKACEETGIKLENLMGADRRLSKVDSEECHHTFNIPCTLLEIDSQAFGAPSLHQLRNLRIIDKFLTPDGYQRVPQMLAITECKSLSFERCSLTKTSIDCLRHGFCEQRVKLHELFIFDKFPGPEEFYEIPSILQETTCAVIGLLGCRLSVEKLDKLGRGCEDKQFTIPLIYIRDNLMTENEFDQLSHTMKKAKCKELLLAECDLNAAKLTAYAERCQHLQLQLDVLYLRCETLDPDGGAALALVLFNTKCPHLRLHDCNTTAKTLNTLHQIHVIELVNKDYQPTDDIINAVCRLIHDTVSYLHMQGWIISDEHSRTLSDVLEMSSAKALGIYHSQRMIQKGVSEEPNRSEESFQTNEVIIRGGQFPNAHFGPQEIQNVYIDQRTIVSSHPKDNASEENLEEFLHRVKLHVTKQTQHVSDIDSHPKTILLDMDGSKTVSSSTKNCETEVLFGRDIADIQMSDFHDKVNGKPTRHVMILGEAGAGKSTLSRTYCIAVQKGHLKTLQCIEMVMFVNAFDLLSDSPSKIFDLFFTHQMAGDPDTELSSELQDAGLQWIQKNSHKMLVIIDGLDQYSSGIGGKRYPKIASDAHAYPDTIIANLMSGNIWPKTLILTTSRWSVYWGLMAPQKPDKVVGLRGFDDLNMEKAAQNLLPESSDSMLSYIRNAAPKLLALCQNPMFLSYTSKVFQTSFADLPDSVSSLLAAVFSDFIHSCHLDDPDLDSVTKLAFCGMMENRFEFSVNYLKKHKIDPAKLEGFLASGAFLKPGQKEAKRQDKKYAFSHQSMQEFCAVIHITNLEKAEIEDFVNNKLNENSMELMRKLFYGIILDERATRRVQDYIEDRTCSIDECREILMKCLLERLSNGVIYDIQFVTLLAECGSTTIDRIKSCLHRIHIDAFDLLRNDQRTLISLITQCSSLKRVYIQQLWLDPLLVENVLRCCQRIEHFEAGYEVTDSISPEDFEPVMNLLENTKIVRVNLRCSDEVKRLFFTRWLEKLQISFDYLGLLNVLDPDIIQHSFKFLSKFSLITLRLSFNFHISKDQLMKQTETDGSIHAVDTILIEDKLLTRQKLDAYFAIFKATAAESLMLCRCDLTVEKLDIIIETCQEIEIKLLRLRILDKLLAPIGYSKIPKMLAKTKCRSLGFEGCNLAKESIECLQNGFREQRVKLESLLLFEKFSGPEEFYEMPSILKETDCVEIAFSNCRLSVEKLAAFGRGCEDKQCVIPRVSVKDKLLTKNGFGEMSVAMRKAKCKELVLSDSDLNKEKLTGYADKCLHVVSHLEWLCVQDLSLDLGSYIGLTTVIANSKCPNVAFVRCNINSENLDSFHQECKTNGITIRNIFFLNKGFEPTNGLMSAVCRLVQDTVIYLIIDGWILSEQHDEDLRNAFQMSSTAQQMRYGGRRIVKENN